MPLTEALWNIHFPTNPDVLRRAQYRLKFEELFYVQLNISDKRQGDVFNVRSIHFIQRIFLSNLTVRRNGC